MFMVPDGIKQRCEKTHHLFLSGLLLTRIYPLFYHSHTLVSLAPILLFWLFWKGVAAIFIAKLKVSNDFINKFIENIRIVSPLVKQQRTCRIS